MQVLTNIDFFFLITQHCSSKFEWWKNAWINRCFQIQNINITLRVPIANVKSYVLSKTLLFFIPEYIIFQFEIHYYLCHGFKTNTFISSVVIYIFLKSVVNLALLQILNAYKICCLNIRNNFNFIDKRIWIISLSQKFL